MQKLRQQGLKTLAAAALALSVGSLQAQTPASTPDTNAALDSLIREAMLYAYPYQEFMKLRHQALEVKDSPTATTLNQFHHSRHLATPKDRWANGPIRDTFYSTSWLDLEKSPVILSVPEYSGTLLRHRHGGCQP